MNFEGFSLFILNNNLWYIKVVIALSAAIIINIIIRKRFI